MEETEVFLNGSSVEDSRSRNQTRGDEDEMEDCCCSGLDAILRFFVFEEKKIRNFRFFCL